MRCVLTAQARELPWARRLACCCVWLPRVYAASLCDCGAFVGAGRQLGVEAIMFARGLAELDDSRSSASASAYRAAGASGPGKGSGGWFRWGLRWMAHKKSDKKSGAQVAAQASQHQQELEPAAATQHPPHSDVVGAEAEGGDGAEEDLDVSLTQEQQDFLYNLSVGHAQHNLSVGHAHATAGGPPASSPRFARSPPHLDQADAATPASHLHTQAQGTDAVPDGIHVDDDERGEGVQETGYAYYAGPSHSQSVSSRDARQAAAQEEEETIAEGADTAAGTSGPGAGDASLESCAGTAASAVPGAACDSPTRGSSPLVGTTAPDVGAPGSEQRGQRGRHVQMRALARHWFGDKARPAAALAQAPAVLVLSLRQLRVTFAVLISGEDAAESPDALPGHDHDEAAAGFVGLQDIVVATVSGIEVRCWVWEAAGGTTVDVTAQDVRVRDLLTTQSCHPWILISRPLPPSGVRFEGDGDWYMPGSAPCETPGEVVDEEARWDSVGENQEGGQAAFKVHVRLDETMVAKTSISLDVNPLEVTLVPESLKALAAYFVPEFEYPFYENLLLDALNAVEEGPRLLAAKLAYLVHAAATGIHAIRIPSFAPLVYFFVAFSSCACIQERCARPARVLLLESRHARTHVNHASACAGVSVHVEGRHLAVVLPVNVADADSAAALVTVKHVKVEVHPYQCLQYSHAAIHRLATRAAKSQSSSERRQLLEQMFMVPISVSLDQVEVFAAQMDAHATKEMASRAALLPSDSKRGWSQVGNGAMKHVGSSLVSPVSLSAEVKLSRMRSDASLPICFVKLNVPELVQTLCPSTARFL